MEHIATDYGGYLELTWELSTIERFTPEVNSLAEIFKCREDGSQRPSTYQTAFQ